VDSSTLSAQLLVSILRGVLPGVDRGVMDACGQKSARSWRTSPVGIGWLRRGCWGRCDMWSCCSCVSCVSCCCWGSLPVVVKIPAFFPGGGALLVEFEDEVESVLWTAAGVSCTEDAATFLMPSDRRRTVCNGMEGGSIWLLPMAPIVTVRGLEPDRLLVADVEEADGPEVLAVVVLVLGSPWGPPGLFHLLLQAAGSSARGLSADLALSGSRVVALVPPGACCGASEIGR
jgi:hypothetical protein